MSAFFMEFKLNPEVYQQHILEKRFGIASNIYNALGVKTQKRYNELVKTKEYRKIQEILLECRENKNDELKKESLKELDLLYEKYGISEFFFHSDIKEFQKYFEKNIDIFTAQNLATTLWKSYEKKIFSEGEKVSYNEVDSIDFLEGKSNTAGIRFLEGKLSWLGTEIPVIIDKKNQYEQEALRNPIDYCRIVKKFIRNKNKYYLQIVFNGTRPTKINTKVNSN